MGQKALLTSTDHFRLFVCVYVFRSDFWRIINISYLCFIAVFVIQRENKFIFFRDSEDSDWSVEVFFWCFKRKKICYTLYHKISYQLYMRIWKVSIRSTKARSDILHSSRSCSIQKLLFYFWNIHVFILTLFWTCGYQIDTCLLFSL